MSRVAVLIAVVAVHIGLIAVFVTSSRFRDETRAEEESMVVVFLPPLSVGERIMPSARATQTNRKVGNTAAKPGSIAARPSAIDSTAISPPLNEVEQTRPVPSTDWSRDAQLAAAREIDSLEEARRRSRGFTPLEANRNASKPRASKPEFGWSHAQIHRIEPIPEGGTLVWINDRCALLLSGGVLPICKVGKIEARGDLFEHMNDASEPGDWKSPMQ
jgi:hypothetical protein